MHDWTRFQKTCIWCLGAIKELERGGYVLTNFDMLPMGTAFFDQLDAGSRPSESEIRACCERLWKVNPDCREANILVAFAQDRGRFEVDDSEEDG